jgi:hypothetical protein
MSNTTFAPFPIPVVTPNGSGYVVYVSKNPNWENDEICVAMDEDGQWRHYNSGQIKSWKNATYGIGTSKSCTSIEVDIPDPIPYKWDIGWTEELYDLFAIELEKMVRHSLDNLDQFRIRFHTVLKVFKEKHNLK